MSNQDEPDDSASSEEEAEMRVFRRIAGALERGDIDELAAALLEDADPARSGPGAIARRKKNDGFVDRVAT